MIHRTEQGELYRRVLVGTAIAGTCTPISKGLRFRMEQTLGNSGAGFFNLSLKVCIARCLCLM
jgi:hypothetical protein